LAASLQRYQSAPNHRDFAALHRLGWRRGFNQRLYSWDQDAPVKRALVPGAHRPESGKDGGENGGRRPDPTNRVDELSPAVLSRDFTDRR
jgi:hypothetical protein